MYVSSLENGQRLWAGGSSLHVGERRLHRRNLQMPKEDLPIHSSSVSVCCGHRWRATRKANNLLLLFPLIAGLVMLKEQDRPVSDCLWGEARKTPWIGISQLACHQPVWGRTSEEWVPRLSSQLPQQRQISVEIERNFLQEAERRCWHPHSLRGYH